MRILIRQLVALGLVAFAACSSTGSESTTTSPSQGVASSPTVSSPPSSQVASLVGRWKQAANVHTCEHYVRGMDEVGLLPAVESSPPYVPGEAWQQVSEQFCKGSMEDWDVVHYHFFDAGGSFGSLNQNEEQVDDGAYTILDAHTFKIGRSKFRYTVRGNTLTIDPVITAAQREEALAKPGKFTDASWMAAVAVPGTSWTRVDCDGWC